jgi:hypothetical protein
LQRQLGNQAVVALLRNGQPNLSAPVGLEGGELDRESESTLRRASSGGAPLDATTRSCFEGAFGGADFSGVRLHRGHEAGELSNRLQAKAFTVGRHIYFGEEAAPATTPAGRELLAHELTHTLQQTGDGIHRMMRRPTMIQRVPVDTPFKHDTIIKHPDWHKEAEHYERRLGSYLYANPVAARAAQAGLHKLHAVLQQYYTLNSTQARKLFAKSDTESAGQIGDGSDDRALYELFGNGNLREMMTAFYNAAYYKGGKDNDPGTTLKALLNDLVSKNDMSRARELDLDDKDLKVQADYIGGQFRSVSEWFIRRVNPDKAYNFSADVFALGNIAAQSQDWKGDLAEITASQAPRAQRSAEEKLTGAEKKYPAQYRWMNAPLSDRELAFLRDNDKPLEVTGFDIVSVPLEGMQLDEQGAPTATAIRTIEREPDVWSVEVHYEMEGGAKKLVDGKPIITDIVKIVKAKKQVEKPRSHDLALGTQGPELPLQWVEGAAYWRIDPDSMWYKRVHDDLGMPVVAGVSGTTARMLKAFQWLNVGSDMMLDFRMAVMGWMLTSWDHSLYEILRGSHMAGVAGEGEAASFTDAVAMYHHPFAPLTTAELREKVCENRMFPDEVIYDRLARADRKDGGLGEPGVAGLRTADRLSGKLKAAADKEETGKGRVDPTVAEWLSTNKTSAKEMWGRLSPAHFLALTAYTGAGHSMINLVVGSAGSGGFVGQKAAPYLFERQLHNFINEELREQKTSPEPLVPSLAGDPELKDLLKEYKAAKEDPALRLKLAEQMHKRVEVIAPTLFQQMKMHADMLVEALNLLPPAVGEVWRGDWKVGGVTDRGGRALSAMAGLFGTYGSRFIDINEFASTSRAQDKALRFLKNYASTSTSHPVLLHLQLKGGRGRDISMFSKIADEKEVLLMPGAKFKVTGTRTEDFDGKLGEVIEAEEV